MILKKEFNILKKPYLAPRIEFEEIEADERILTKGSTTDVKVPYPEQGPGDADPESLEADFVVNDTNSEFKW
jgi:hypothetical protein